jgi:hypothetical protein
MALSKVNFNSMNVTPAASKAIKFNSSNNGLETGDLGGSLVLLSTQTASSSATIDFTSDIDSTYKEYIFKYINVHPATDNVQFGFQVDTGTNTSYGQTVTSTFFRAVLSETDDPPNLARVASQDQQKETGSQTLAYGIGNDNDQSASGVLHLFDPSASTYYKHFIGRGESIIASNQAYDSFVGGMFYQTAALTRVRFKMSSGNIDSGTIKMYGVS